MGAVENGVPSARETAAVAFAGAALGLYVAAHFVAALLQAVFPVIV